VARTKAFKDVLPANAREFFRKSNTEQVAGRVSSSLSPQARQALNSIRNTLGTNTILGNLSTTAMQLTSIPQVIAFAGPYNTMIGYAKRFASFLNHDAGMYQYSRTKHTRSLSTDIGIGRSLINDLVTLTGKYTKTKQLAAKTNIATDVGRKALMWLMETADQVTVGATFEAFYYKAIRDGKTLEEAMEYADIMTGKTQANYYKEAIPPFLNTVGGRFMAQFGTYTMNQFEMLKHDFGKEFNLGQQSKKSKILYTEQMMMFMLIAYFVDGLSEKIFGRQPYDIKDWVDSVIEGDPNKVFNQTRATVSSYIPFLSSAKFGSMPPVFEFGKDIALLISGNEQDSKKAWNEIKSKWSFNILAPYGGNQIRKTLQGIEASTGIDFPLVYDPSRKGSGDVKFVVEGIDVIKAIMFGPWQSDAGLEYIQGLDSTKKDVISYTSPGHFIPAPTVKLNTEEFLSSRPTDLSLFSGNAIAPPVGTKLTFR